MVFSLLHPAGSEGLSGDVHVAPESPPVVAQVAKLPDASLDASAPPFIPKPQADRLMQIIDVTDETSQIHGAYHLPPRPFHRSSHLQAPRTFVGFHPFYGTPVMQACVNPCHAAVPGMGAWMPAPPWSAGYPWPAALGYGAMGAPWLASPEHGPASAMYLSHDFETF